MEASVTYASTSQLYGLPPPKRQRLEHPTSSTFAYGSSYCDGASSTPPENAAAFVGGSNSYSPSTLGTCDNSATALYASLRSPGSGNFCLDGPHSSDASLRINQGGEATDSHACSQSNEVSSSEDSVANSDTYSPGYGFWCPKETCSFMVQSNNSRNTDKANFPFSRAVHFAQASSKRELDSSTSNPVSSGDENFLPNSSLSSSNSTHEFLPRDNFAFPNGRSTTSIFGPCNPGSYFVQGNNSDQILGSNADCSSDCKAWHSAPYGPVQDSSVGSNPALYLGAPHFPNIQGSSKILPGELNNSRHQSSSFLTPAQVAYGSGNNVWFLFPYVQNFNSFSNSFACIHPGTFLTGVNVPCSQRISQLASSEFNITDTTSSTISAATNLAGDDGCSAHGQNCGSIEGGALHTSPSAYLPNFARAQCSNEIPSAKLSSSSDIQNSTLSTPAKNDNSRNPGRNNQETANHVSMDSSAKDDIDITATVRDSNKADIPSSIVEGHPGDLSDDGNSVVTAAICDSNATSAEEAAEAAGINATPGIGPRLFPNSCAANPKLLTSWTFLDAIKQTQNKLKWPLPIPINIKVQRRNMSFTDIDYDYVTQYIYREAREEVYAQSIDKNGRLRVFVKSPRAASNLLQMEYVGGVAVQCTIAQGYTDTIGFIRGVPKRYTEATLFELLQDEGVICAKRQLGYLRYDNGSVGGTVTGTVVLTFLPDRRLPKSVTIDHVVYEVIRRLQLPMQCYNCQRIGHYASECVAPVCCRLCSGRHSYENCFQKNKPRCANCHGNHASTFWKCPVRLEVASSDPRNAWMQKLGKDI